jgi:cytochrome c2
MLAGIMIHRLKVKLMTWTLFLLAALVAGLVACSPDKPDFTFRDLPAGDAGSGSKLFEQGRNDAPSCASCHQGEGGIGPALTGIGEVAATRVDGESAEEYLFNSIIRPAKYLVQGYSNVMYSDYATVYEPADIADLIAYLRNL